MSCLSFICFQQLVLINYIVQFVWKRDVNTKKNFISVIQSEGAISYECFKRCERKIQKKNIPRFVGKKLCNENAFHGLSCVGCNLNTYKHHSVINHLHSMYTCAAYNQVYYVRNNQNLQRMFFSIKAFHMNRIFGASSLLISMEWSGFRFLRIDKNFNFCIAFRLLFVNWFKAHVSR